MERSWVNGKAETSISLNDRGLLYGDGFFTTALVREGQILLKDLHLQRLREAGQRLGIAIDIEDLAQQMETFVHENADNNANKVLAQNNADEADILKVIVTRKHTGRGYHSGGNREANTILQAFHFTTADREGLYSKRERGLSICCADKRLGHNAELAGIKHLSKLDHVLIASDIDQRRFDEALVLDKQDNVIEGLSSNVFIFPEDKRKLVMTPVLDQAGVAGVMRKYLLEQFASAGFEVKIMHLSISDVLKSPAVFMSNCVLGFCKVNSIFETNWLPDTEFEAGIAAVPDMSLVSL